MTHADQQGGATPRATTGNTVRTYCERHNRRTLGGLVKKTIIISSIVSAAMAATTTAASQRNMHRLLDRKAERLAVRRLRADVDALYAHHMMSRETL